MKENPQPSQCQLEQAATMVSPQLRGTSILCTINTKFTNKSGKNKIRVALTVLLDIAPF